MEILTTYGFTKGNYGRWLNTVMESAPCEWVCFIDHDAMPVTPDWFGVLQGHIETNPDAGLFTCRTNRIGNGEQKVVGVDQANHNILYHKDIANDLIEVNTLRDVSEANEGWPSHVISGVLMLTSKTAWKKAGGFRTKGGHIGLDNDYHRRIRNAGLKTYIMWGFYVYHRYRAT